MTKTSFLIAACIGAFAAVGAQASVITFDTPVTTGSTAAPGVWYTDRYAPAGFETAMFDGDMRLKQSISAADGASSRPSGFSAGFYDTQGRKLDAPDATTSLSIDLYIDASWTDPTRRYAGLWGTAVNAADVISYYPIIEFGAGVLRYWNGAGWVNTSASAAFGSWMNFSIELVGGDWVYEIDGVNVGSVTANSSVRIDNVILQGHNTTAGVSYDIFWDNLAFGSAAAVAAPGSLALAGLGLFGMLALRRRRVA